MNLEYATISLSNNILCFHYGICKEYPAILPQLNAQRKPIPNIPQLLIGLINLKVYPNPAQDFVAFDYEFAENFSDVHIEVTDINGKTIEKMYCKDAKNQVVWNTQNISSGVYLYACKQGKEKLAIGKIVIQH